MLRRLRLAVLAALAIAGAGALIAGQAGDSLAQSKSRFVFANASPYDTMDPHVVFDIGRIAVRLNLYDALIRWVDSPAKMEPWLAESWSASPDGLTYTFKLRKGVKFHDGKEMKAADVVYSMERILALKLGAFSLFEPMLTPGSTTAADDYTVVFKLKQPSAIFVAITSELHVLNSALVKANTKDDDWGKAWLSKSDAGTGSYILKRFDPAIGFSATRFKDHFMGWAHAAKPIEEIEFRTVMEVNSRVLGLIKGDFQFTDGYLPQDQVKRIRESGTIDIAEAESMRIFYAIIHSGREPMSDVNFRKALSYAFDYDGFNKNILSDSVARNPGPVPNNIWGAPKDLKGYTYDLEKAKEYLAKVKQPIREITLGTLGGFQQTEQAASLFQASLTKLGIKSKIVTEPWPVITNKMRDKEQMYDILFIWRSTYYADPHNWVGEMYECAQIGARNNSWYCNPEVDKLLVEALKSSDQALRQKNYEQAARLVTEDAAGIFVYNTKWFGPISKRLKGVRFSPVGDGQDMRWASMD